MTFPRNVINLCPAKWIASADIGFCSGFGQSGFPFGPNSASSFQIRGLTRSTAVFGVGSRLTAVSGTCAGQGQRCKGHGKGYSSVFERGVLTASSWRALLLIAKASCSALERWIRKGGFKFFQFHKRRPRYLISTHRKYLHRGLSGGVRREMGTKSRAITCMAD